MFLKFKYLFKQTWLFTLLISQIFTYDDVRLEITCNLISAFLDDKIYYVLRYKNLSLVDYDKESS